MDFPRLGLFDDMALALEGAVILQYFPFISLLFDFDFIAFFDLARLT
jgi:hypothetical protein